MRVRRALVFALAVILCGPMRVPAHADGVAAVSVFDRATKEITLPAGTRLSVVLDTPVASNTSRAEQAVSGHLSRDVMANGVVVVPAGSEVLVLRLASPV